ncbi:MAG TPA: C45 family autoproteolytic acyltransferase/hydrolase [bacterium]|nr:C45 family autoproteolytic acyltransferase/hydrolase [bacterium]HPN44292.1 C45 family autoproteolytic acyltransferase/hydrolase [bacterium]
MYHPRFKGNHYDIGYKLGSLLKKNNIQLYGFNALDDFQYRYGSQSEPVISKYFPQAGAEMRGMAEAMDISYARFSAWLLCISVCLKMPHCSMLACHHNGQIILGRNNDLSPIFRKMSCSALYAPADGYSFIANSSAFVGAEDGINEKGLAAGMTYIWAKELKPGMNSMFLVRYILEKCASVQQGLEAIQTIPIGGAFHLLLADNHEIAHAECSPQKIKINRGNFLAATNHFISKEMQRYEEPKDLYHSYSRYETAVRAADNVPGDAVEYIKGILSGKKGFMCQYEKALNFETVWSSVYDITGAIIYRAEGNPARVRYKEESRLFL